MDLPEVLAETWHSDSKFEVELALTPEMDCFRGHFDDAPVLAGVIQVGWAFRFAEQKLQQNWFFRGMQSAKFQRLILPPVQLRLQVDFLPARQMFRFRYSGNGKVYSSGAIRVVARDEWQSGDE